MNQVVHGLELWWDGGRDVFQTVGCVFFVWIVIINDVLFRYGEYVVRLIVLIVVKSANLAIAFRL